MTFKALKEFMVRFLFENHETLKIYSCNLKYFPASRCLKYLTFIQSSLCSRVKDHFRINFEIEM